MDKKDIIVLFLCLFLFAVLSTVIFSFVLATWNAYFFNLYEEIVFVVEDPDSILSSHGVAKAGTYIVDSEGNLVSYISP